MTTYLLAGGGTAGHVNPLLAVADRIRETAPADEVLVLGTAEGLESRLVPARGYELLIVPRLPFPRRPGLAAARFPAAYRASVASVVRLLDQRNVDVVTGFGGYASAPAYAAARRSHVPFAIHEANAKPGLANRLGARSTEFVGVAFDGTPLPHAQTVGMPLRAEIERLDRAAVREEALAAFDLVPDRPVLLVTGGSLGARSINTTVAASVEKLVAAGWQILHIQGGRAELEDPGLAYYNLIDYCDRMDLALAAADFAITRAGAATVSELSALGIPAVYVPYPVGNGEQRFNVQGVVSAGGGIVIDDAAFTPEWIEVTLIPRLSDEAAVASMGARAAAVGHLDGTARTLDLIRSALPPY